ncbi:rRNA N(6)-adenosine-methyltransferase ZCCHC4 isoform X1 [Tachypleus tridentatus]|uniref:rRNA N(6)-adenosine-methyltransferase ZCCHC4 isoform X1 n=1 Tax=Tachypleus tridentatus TaxID=6853 RepID=UPI003FCF33AC
MENQSIDFIPSFEDSHPKCLHGPTLLFERFTVEGKRTGRKFFACSSCRDRNDCPFFQWADEQIPHHVQQKRKKHAEIANTLNLSSETIHEQLKRLLSLPCHKRIFCKTCFLLVLPKEFGNHKDHEILERLSDKILMQPSYLLPTLPKNKKEAQYFFDEKTVAFVISTVISLGFKRILSIGTPRIHEYIKTNKTTDLQSLLLDIDKRYAHFYESSEFCYYNMFNHFFFDGETAEATYKNFLLKDDENSLLVMLDPPFGGLVDVISHTLKKIFNTWRNGRCDTSADLPFFWFFPYFNEARIQQCLPSLNMLDYKVNYDNHRLFNGSVKGRKQGSPVRIFTNIKLEKIKLPEEDGYRFCPLCKKYVAPENEHCNICNTCPSKDGRPYKHCNDCNRCVKNSRQHCDTCGQCMLPNHECGVVSRAGRCHICGALGHKRRECPNKDDYSAPRKKKKLQ